MPQLIALLIGLAAGLVICGIFTAFIFRLRMKMIRETVSATFEADNRVLRERCAVAEKEVDRLRNEFEIMREQLIIVKSGNSGLQSKCTELEKRIVEFDSAVGKKDSRIDELSSIINDNRAEIAELKTRIDAERRQADEKLKLLTEARDQLKSEFQNLANSIFDEKTKRFSEQNKANLDLVLNPLRDQLGDFRKKVEDVYVNESKDRQALSEHIKILTQLNQQVSKDADNLTRALKGENKTQGNWGEMILGRALELSGLTEGIEYETQVSAVDDSGKRLQPDVVVHLPEGRDIVVDSKVSLTAYELFVNSEDEERQNKALDSHLVSVRSHIDELSSKSYDSIQKFKSLDFVLMFMPVEAAFVAAIRKEPGLFEYAYARRIIIVSPSTLLVVLRTIQNMWQSEYQNRNAQEIAKKAADLYDKFAGFVETLSEVKKAIGNASDKCDKAVKLLSTGNGNIVRKIEEFRKMGVKPKKSLAETVVEQPLEDDLFSEISHPQE